ncbi:DUF4232 domain-containing protein [Agromyces bauzanensis]
MLLRLPRLRRPCRPARRRRPRLRLRSPKRRILFGRTIGVRTSSSPPSSWSDRTFRKGARRGSRSFLRTCPEQSCSYNGFPGVHLLGADGTLLTSSGDSPLTTDFSPGALAPGESAQVEGQLTEVGAYDCTPTIATTVRVLVTSDGAGPGIDAPADLQVCADARSDLSTGPLIPAS